MKILKNAEYEAIIAESTSYQILIENLKQENKTLSKNSSFYKLEMQKAQDEIQNLLAQNEKVANELDWQIRHAESQRNDYSTRLANMQNQMDSLEKKNAILMRDIEKLKKKQEKNLIEKPVIDISEIDFNVDKAIANLEFVDVKINTENLLAIDIDPDPPLKRKYDYSEKCLKGDYIAFDLETTGLSPKKDYIIELSAVRFRNFIPIAAYSTLVNPVIMDIPATVARITGIHDDDVCEAPLIHEVMQSFTDFVGDDDMVGHNIRAFDLKFLYRFGFEMDNSPRRYYDTLNMAKKILPDEAVENNKLETLLDYFGIVRSSAHRGVTDSVSEGMLFAKLIYLKA